MSDDSKVCPKCNTDISSETGKCFYCTPVSSEILSNKDNDALSKKEQRQTDNLLLLVFASMANVPIGIIITKWVSSFLYQTFPLLSSKYLSRLGVVIFIFSYAISFIAITIAYAFFSELNRNPKKTFDGIVDLVINGTPKLFEFLVAVIALVLFHIFRIAFFIFIGLFGVALIVFAFKFIKNQLFN
jgi:hypothetical protein